jgi:hypothetical protein
VCVRLDARQRVQRDQQLRAAARALVQSREPAPWLGIVGSGLRPSIERALLASIVCQVRGAQVSQLACACGPALVDSLALQELFERARQRSIVGECLAQLGEPLASLRIIGVDLQQHSAQRLAGLRALIQLPQDLREREQPLAHALGLWLQVGQLAQSFRKPRLVVALAGVCFQVAVSFEIVLNLVQAREHVGGGLLVVQRPCEQPCHAAIQLGTRLCLLFGACALAEQRQQLFEALAALTEARELFGDHVVLRRELKSLAQKLVCALLIEQIGLRDRRHARQELDRLRCGRALQPA